MAFIKRFLKKKKGLATVETALVMLMLVVVTFGAMEYGWVFFRMQQVSNISREAARTAALANRTQADVQNRVDFLMGQWGMDSVGATTTIYPGSFASAPTGTAVTITINVPYEGLQLVGLPQVLVPTPENLTSTATMAKEGS
jgi:Flp pilus assembly protein TadG